MTLTSGGPEPTVYAYGAYLHGGRLRVGLLFVQRGLPSREVTLHTPTNEELRVRLPPEALKASRNLRFYKEELEVLP